MSEMLDFLMPLGLLLGIIVPLFLLVVWKNAGGKGMYARRMASQAERERFMDDWAQPERRTLPEDGDVEMDFPDRASSPWLPEPDKMDGLDFVNRLRRLHARLERGEITRSEFQRISRRLAQQSWADKDQQEGE